MNRLQVLKAALAGSASVVTFIQPAAAKIYDVPEGDLATALVSYMKQSDVDIIYSDNVVRGRKSRGAKGDYTETAALSQILRGTGLSPQTMPMNVIDIVPEHKPAPEQVTSTKPLKVAAAAPASVETVVVTAQKKAEDIQQVPIAVTALSQQQLTERQIAGGPDLLREVPNMDFTKTNFSGYNIELRGIGTQAISVTTDPAVAVAFNDIPFIRNHFFEQEFYDLADAEVLRGPQGTLYGRNATAGVVNLKSALPTDSYEAMLSADMGNYSNRRLEAMLNIPIDGDKLDLRIAGEWTKRDGYTEDTTLNTPVDGRDLWSGRVTIGWKPASDVQTYLIWEHFSEDDDRLRSGKQLCKTDPGPSEVDGMPSLTSGNLIPYDPALYLSQGCLPTSLYSSNAFEVPNGISLPYYEPLGEVGIPVVPANSLFDPYASTTQSTNLRDIESAIRPHYRAKNDTLEYNATWQIDRSLTLTSQTGYNNDFLWSTEDYNRFNTAPGAFVYAGPCSIDPNNCLVFPINPLGETIPDPNPEAPPGSGVFCDPQLGCSDRLVAQDLSDERAWQFSQEFRLASNFGGPLNFSAGGNYLHYETVENYYVFINSLTMAAYGWKGGGQNQPWIPGVSTGANCLVGGFQNPSPYNLNQLGTEGGSNCIYVDPGPLTGLNNQGHNYFLSQNPYVLNSYAAFGEAYYDITPDLKLTAGVRWTEDQKHFLDIPSELLVPGAGYPVTNIVDQRWDAPTGRVLLDWTPQLDFTDQTLIYGSYAHGYKAGGANPPGASLIAFGEHGDIINPIHPLTFKPEYIEAFELGAKNTLLDGSLTLNGDVFYYNYTGYQISEIVDRTAINNNYNAHVEGAEVEANWEPLPGLKFNFAGGWEDTAAAGGDQGVDLMDRTAGMPGWMVVKPFVTQASNCILPTYVVAASLVNNPGQFPDYSLGAINQACATAYSEHLDPITRLPYVQDPSTSVFGYPLISPPPSYTGPNPYPGFDPATAPNNGEGFDKNLAGHALPNAPPFTVSLGGEYSLPVSQDWVGTFRADFYWQDDSWARIFNDNPYDRIRGYANLNLTLILTSANGWQVMGYIKNVFDTTAITGDFLNSDDSGLTTNVFLTDPRLYGVRVTKQLDANDGFWGSDYNGADFFTNLFSDADGGKPPLWIELGGQLNRLDDGQATFASPPVMAARPVMFAPSQNFERPPLTGLDETAKVSFEPADSDWVVSASVRFGRSSTRRDFHQQSNAKPLIELFYYGGIERTFSFTHGANKFADTAVQNSEQHTVIDFQAGKDVGLGLFGMADSPSVLSAGVRFAQFASRSNIALKSDPDARFTNYHYFTFIKTLQGGTLKRPHGTAYHLNSASLTAKRSFHGVGPSISWNASTRVVGVPQDGEIAFDWGLNAGVLFGRQRTRTQHQTTAQYHHGYRNYASFGFHRTTLYQSVHPAQTRSRWVAVPNLGGFVGLSMKYNNARVSFGYRADEFFDAIDGGIDTRKSENRGFFGPYANISIGLGG